MRLYFYERWGVEDNWTTTTPVYTFIAENDSPTIDGVGTWLIECDGKTYVGTRDINTALVFNLSNIQAAPAQISRPDAIADSVWTLNWENAGPVLLPSSMVPPPPPPPSYTNYSTEYTTLSGGTLVEVTHAGGVHNLNDTIDSMTDGDALLLSPGIYEIDGVTDTTDGGNPDMSYTNDYMRMKNIALVGKSDNPSDITVHLREGPASYIDGGYDPIFGAYSGVTSGWLRHFAYLKVVRHTTQSVPYGVALAGYHAGATKGYAKNVIFDLGGSPVSWRYNNSNTSQKVKFEDCSFVNYSEWLSSYSGAAGTVIVEDCAFSGTANLGDSRISTSGTNIENVTFNNSFEYTPTTSGHLNEATSPSTVSISDPS